MQELSGVEEVLRRLRVKRAMGQILLVLVACRALVRVSEEPVVGQLGAEGGCASQALEVDHEREVGEEGVGWQQARQAGYRCYRVRRPS